MIFRETSIAGAFLIEPERVVDERGYFARTWCRHEFAKRGLVVDWAQTSVSHNPHRGTLRGMHWQAPPHEEAKLIRCSRGTIYDVIVDVRPHSATRWQWFAAELSAETGLQMYVPPCVAHGFLTRTSDCEVCYQISTPYHAESARGVLWNDPRLAIDWPDAPTVISPRDAAYELLQEPAAVAGTNTFSGA